MKLEDIKTFLSNVQDSVQRFRGFFKKLLSLEFN